MHILLTIIYGGALKPGWKMELYEPEIRHVLRLLTQILKITYIYRRIPHSPAVGPGYIRFCDGDPITFGGGPEARQLGTGPLPLLCNLQLAVARVLKMSGAAELIAQIIEDGDDSDFPHVYVASPAFCDVLTAQLLASGRALIY
jgi:hypothetical protein